MLDQLWIHIQVGIVSLEIEITIILLKWYFTPNI